jgi:hypothetical protein
MKRILCAIAAAALLGQAATIFAQDSGEPSEQSVLDAARAKYWQDKAPDSQAPEAGQELDQQDQSPYDGSGAENDNPVPYTPFLLSLVPGISLPFGYYDASFAGGAVAVIARDVTGAEGSGVFNLARDIHGFQGAGVFNISRNVTGAQGAGVFNIVDRDLTGFQGAGVFNIVRGSVSGFQGAGVFNMAKKALTPLQAAGVFNIDDEIVGFQAAGVFNIAGSVSGGQAAGVFNAAKVVRGVQIGVVNVAGNIEGFQLGLVNIAGNGIRSVGVDYEPATDYFFARRQAGIQSLYTVIGLGAPSGDWFKNLDGFIASFGLGSRARLFGLTLDLDVSASQPIAGIPTDAAAWKDCGVAAWTRFRPYPTISLMAGAPIGGRLRIVGGLKADVDFDSLGDRVPEAQKQGGTWRSSAFGESFTAYYKWFFGLRI